MNLKPRVWSNRLAALMSPMLPSLIMSASERPLPWYFFATETTKRRFASTNSFMAFSSFACIRIASSTSRSGGSGLNFPISAKYMLMLPLETLLGFVFFFIGFFAAGFVGFLRTFTATSWSFFVLANSMTPD